MRPDQLPNVPLKQAEEYWDADRTIDAMDNLRRLERMGFITLSEAELLTRTVRAMFRKQANLPRLDGDPEV